MNLIFQKVYNTFFIQTTNKIHNFYTFQPSLIHMKKKITPKFFFIENPPKLTFQKTAKKTIASRKKPKFDALFIGQ